MSRVGDGAYGRMRRMSSGKRSQRNALAVCCQAASCGAYSPSPVMHARKPQTDATHRSQTEALSVIECTAVDFASKQRKRAVASARIFASKLTLRVYSKRRASSFQRRRARIMGSRSTTNSIVD
eukprot:700571-Prymnesium_polylepis.1